MRLRTPSTLLALLGAAALAVGCGDSSNDAPAAAPSSNAGEATAATSLKDVCPSTIVVQTDWNPESDHSELYELADSGGKIDAKKKAYTAPLISQGKKTGVNIEIRSGGPAIGFQNPTQQMYTDDKIMLGYVNTDEAIQNSAKKPTVAVVAPRENWAQILMYDPETYDFKSIEEIGKTDTKVLVFQGQSYMSYLTGTGILKKEQIDASYDGKPARFVTAGGKDVQQGFISAEPWMYENEIKQWSKPVKSLLISETGYPNYGESLAVKPDTLTKESDCLKKLVPMIQQAQVDYAADPERANALIVQLVGEYKTGWVYPKGLADYAVQAQLDNKIIDNGKDDTLGNFEEERVQRMIDITKPIAAKNNIEIKEGLKPSDIIDNQFIDPAIGLK